MDADIAHATLVLTTHGVFTTPFRVSFSVLSQGVDDVVHFTPNPPHYTIGPPVL